MNQVLWRYLASLMATELTKGIQVILYWFIFFLLCVSGLCSRQNILGHNLWSVRVNLCYLCASLFVMFTDCCFLLLRILHSHLYPDSKVHGANMGPIWGRQDPGGPHVGPTNFALWGAIIPGDSCNHIDCLMQNRLDVKKETPLC